LSSLIFYSLALKSHAQHRIVVKTYVNEVVACAVVDGKFCALVFLGNLRVYLLCESGLRLVELLNLAHQFENLT